MSIKRNFRKLLWILVWMVLASGIVVMLGAAISKKNGRTCRKALVVINAGQQRLYGDPQQVLDQLSAHGSKPLVGKPIQSFDLRSMEKTLEKNVWIQRAVVFFDHQDVLQVAITERKPLARIFSVSGQSFCVDSQLVQLPLPEHPVADLPVFTGFPFSRISAHGADSLLALDLKTLCFFLDRQPFWMDAIQQIGIGPDHQFELVPIVGNHLILLGDASQLEDKMHRLQLFYQQVMVPSGMDRYSSVDLRFRQQVVATKKEGSISKADSLRALAQVRAMIRDAQRLRQDTTAQEAKPLEHNTLTEQTLVGYDLIDEPVDSSGRQPEAKGSRGNRVSLPKSNQGHPTNPHHTLK